MKIQVTVKSKLSGREEKGYVTAKHLLETYEEDLVLELVECNCQPVGETYVVECNCIDEWEEYALTIEDEIIQ